LHNNIALDLSFDEAPRKPFTPHQQRCERIAAMISKVASTVQADVSNTFQRRVSMLRKAHRQMRHSGKNFSCGQLKNIADHDRNRHARLFTFKKSESNFDS